MTGIFPHDAKVASVTPIDKGSDNKSIIQIIDKWVFQIASLRYETHQNATTVVVIILWDFLMFYQLFLSPQIKQSVVISNKT